MARSKTHRMPGWTIGIALIGMPAVAPAQVPERADLPRPAEARSAPGTLAEGSGDGSFAMSPAVVCSRVEGFGRFVPLPDATLTNADKLKVYFRPLRFKVATDDAARAPYRAHFTEDGRIRRKGEKTVLAKEDKLLEYDTRFETIDYQIYLVNTIGLEQLPPGDYEFDIALHDMIDGTATARQTVSFRIVATEAQAAAKVPAPAEAPPPQKAKKITGPARSSKRPGR